MVRRVGGLVAAALVSMVLSGCVTMADFSPDGKRIAVGGRTGLRIVDTDARGDTKVAWRGGAVWAPRWSPDGKRLLFISGTSFGANHATLRLYDAVSGTVEAIGDGFLPPVAWASDSRRFVAVHERSANDVELLWHEVGTPDVARSLRLTEPLCPFANDALVWVPGTDTEAFLGVPPGSQNGCSVVLLAAGKVRKLTKVDDAVGLSLSSDHKRIVWVGQGSDARHPKLALWSYAPDTKAVTALPFASGGITAGLERGASVNRVVHMYFSPDGARLAMVAELSVPAYPARGQRGVLSATEPYVAVFTLRSDGTGCRELCRQWGTAGSDPNHTVWCSVAWSPDGARAVVNVATKVRVRSYLYAVETGDSRIIARGLRK